MWSLTATSPLSNSSGEHKATNNVLLNDVKIQVKKLMEDSVMLGYIHEENTVITLLCASVESILSYGIRQNSLNLFDDASTLAICRRISTTCSAARHTLERMEYHRNTMQGSTSRRPVSINNDVAVVFRSRSNTRLRTTSPLSAVSLTGKPLLERNSYGINTDGYPYNENRYATLKVTPSRPIADTRFRNFWIRVALLEKDLEDIVLYIAKHAHRFYEKWSVMADPCDALLFADLLRGCSSVDYSRTRTTDHLFSDPPVSELIQRHGISGSLMSRQLSYIRPSTSGWCYSKNTPLTVRSNEHGELTGKRDESGSTDTLNGSSNVQLRNCLSAELKQQSCVSLQDCEKQSNNACLGAVSRQSFTASTDQLNRPNVNGNHCVSDSHLVDNGLTSSQATPGSTRLPRKWLALAAKEHVESMHQGIRSTLLFGKNNVLTQTSDDEKPIPGYLSVHDQGVGIGLVIKWTPNYAIVKNHCRSSDETENQCQQSRNQVDNQDPLFAYREVATVLTYACNPSKRDLPPSTAFLNLHHSAYWNYAMKVWLSDLAYLHCHDLDGMPLVSLVRIDGICSAPLRFQVASHIASFLECLEKGLVEHGGHFDPPYSGNSRKETAADDNGALSWAGYYRGMTAILSGWLTEPSSPAVDRKQLDKQSPRVSSGNWDDDGSLISEIQSLPNVRGDAENSFSPEAHRSMAIFRIVCGDLKKPVQSSNHQMMSEREPPVDTDQNRELNHLPRSSAYDVMETVRSSFRQSLLLDSFRKWLSHCRKVRIWKAHLTGIVTSRFVTVDLPSPAHDGLTEKTWNLHLADRSSDLTFLELCRRVYFGNCAPAIRSQVWPYLLGVYPWNASPTELEQLREHYKTDYFSTLNDWRTVEAAGLSQLEGVKLDSSVKALHATSLSVPPEPPPDGQCYICYLQQQNIRETLHLSTVVVPPIDSTQSAVEVQKVHLPIDLSVEEGDPEKAASQAGASLSPRASSVEPVSAWLSSCDNDNGAPSAVAIGACTKGGAASVSSLHHLHSPENLSKMADNIYRIDKDVLRCDRNHTFFAPPKRMPGEGNPSAYSDEPILGQNLIKLRNVVCTWVWLHLDVGYIQGMCDLLAPLLIVLEDEALAFACFCSLMEWMLPNFPDSCTPPTPSPNAVSSRAGNTPNGGGSCNSRRLTLLQLTGTSPNKGGRPSYLSIRQTTTPVLTRNGTLLSYRRRKDSGSGSRTPAVASPYARKLGPAGGSCMDLRFQALHALLELFDPELYKHLVLKSLGNQFYFCYRWLLLDFKREFRYVDVFPTWEIIWSARRLVSFDFALFIAVALLQYYRDIILYYDMDITEIIRFYNELTEQHMASTVLELARSLVFQLQSFIDDS